MKTNLKLYDVPQIETIQQMVLESAEKYSDKIALEDLNPTPIQSVTFKELLKYILKFGTALRQLGLQERAHIALIGENRVQWSISYLTSMCFNYVIVPIDKNLNSNEILNIVHESDAEAIIFSESFSSTFSGSHTYLKKLKYFICMDKTREDPKFLNMLD